MLSACSQPRCWKLTGLQAHSEMWHDLDSADAMPLVMIQDVARHWGADGGVTAVTGFIRSFSLIFCMGGPSYARVGGAVGGRPASRASAAAAAGFLPGAGAGPPCQSAVAAPPPPAFVPGSAQNGRPSASWYCDGTADGTFPNEHGRLSAMVRSRCARFPKIQACLQFYTPL